MKPFKYPKTNEITMVVPIRITNTAVYVSLIEYDNIEGLIILSDLSKSRFRSINKIVSIGKKFAALVLSVDENTSNISLSKKDVSIEESNKCQDNFKLSKDIDAIVNFYIRKMMADFNIKIEPITVYQVFIWPISLDPESIIYYFKIASKDFDKIYANKLENINPLWSNCFRNILEIKFRDRELLLEAVLEINCFESEGINIIRESLIKGQLMATPELPFKIKLIKAPYYSIILKTVNIDKAIELINTTIANIKSELEQNSATIKIIKLPKAIVDKEFEPTSDDESDNEDDTEDDHEN